MNLNHKPNYFVTNTIENQSIAFTFNTLEECRDYINAVVFDASLPYNPIICLYGFHSDEDAYILMEVIALVQQPAYKGKL